MKNLSVFLCAVCLCLFACEQNNYRTNESTDLRNEDTFVLAQKKYLAIQDVLEAMINEKFSDRLANEVKRADVLEALQEAMESGELDDLPGLGINITIEHITLTPDMDADTLKVEIQYPGIKKFEHTLKDFPRYLSPYYRVHSLLKEKLDFDEPGWNVNATKVKDIIYREPRLEAQLRLNGYDPQYTDVETNEATVTVKIYKSELKDEDFSLAPEERCLWVRVAGFATQANDTFEARKSQFENLLGKAYVKKLSTKLDKFVAGSQPNKVLALRHPDHKPESLYTGRAIALSLFDLPSTFSGEDDDGHDIKDPFYTVRLWQSKANGMFRDGLYLHSEPKVKGILRVLMNDDEGNCIVQFGEKGSGNGWPTVPMFKDYFDKGTRYRLKDQGDGSVLFESLEYGRDIVGYFFEPKREVTKEYLKGKKFILDNVKHDGDRDYPNYRFLIFRKETGKPAWEFQYHFHKEHKYDHGGFEGRQTDTHERREMLYQDMEWDFDPNTGLIHAWVNNLDDIYREAYYYKDGTVKKYRGDKFRKLYDEWAWWPDDIYGWDDDYWDDWIKDKKQFSLDGRISWSYTEQGKLVLKSKHWLNDQQPKSWRGGYGAFWFMDVDQNLEGLGESLPSAANMHFVPVVRLRPFEGQWADLWPGHE